MSSTTTFSLLSSTRYDATLLNVDWNTEVNGGNPSAFLLLPYHFDRLVDAAKQHSWTECLKSFSLENLSRVCKEAVETASVEHGGSPMKVRL